MLDILSGIHVSKNQLPGPLHILCYKLVLIFHVGLWSKFYFKNRSSFSSSEVSDGGSHVHAVETESPWNVIFVVFGCETYLH